MILSNQHTTDASFTDGARTELDVVEFKRLLTDIFEKRPDISIRYRLIGNLWSNAFFPIRKMSEEEVFFFDSARQSLIRVFVRDIMQIELDSSFQNYRPNLHYTIKVA